MKRVAVELEHEPLADQAIDMMSVDPHLRHHPHATLGEAHTRKGLEPTVCSAIRFGDRRLEAAADLRREAQELRAADEPSIQSGVDGRDRSLVRLASGEVHQDVLDRVDHGA